MQQDFMLYIRNAGDAKAALSADERFTFIKQCETYIRQLKSKDNFISAQPLVRQGFVIAKTTSAWTETPIDPSKEVQVGYYHVLVTDMEETIAIAKNNPEFVFVPSATIEVRPIERKEAQTNFVYPNSKK